MGTDTSTALAELSAAGVSIWPDDISRDRLNIGNLADLVANKHVVGVTSNRRSSRRPWRRPLLMAARNGQIRAAIGGDPAVFHPLSPLTVPLLLKPREKDPR